MTIGVVALILLMAYEYLAVATAMPVVATALRGESLYALAFSGSLATSVIAMVAGGRWNDVTGPHAPIWVGVICFMIGLTVSGLAPHMEVFIAGRLLQGFGSGLFTVSLYVLVGRVYPPEMHPKVFSLLAAAWVVPSMVGPTITGLLVDGPGWQWVFLGVPAVAAPAALLLWRGLTGVGRVTATGHENAPQDGSDVGVGPAVGGRTSGGDVPSGRGSAVKGDAAPLHEAGAVGGKPYGGDVPSGRGSSGEGEAARLREMGGAGGGAPGGDAVSRENGAHDPVGGAEGETRSEDEARFGGEGQSGDGVADGSAPKRGGALGRKLRWAVAAAVGAALLQYGGGLLQEGLGRQGGLGAGLLLAGLVVLGVALPPLLPAGTLRAARGLPTVVALRGLAAGAFFAAEVLVPLMLTTERGLRPWQAGLALTGSALAWSFGSWIQGRRPGNRLLILRGGTALIAVGAALVGLTLFPAVPVLVCFVAWAISGLGIGMVYPTLSVLILELSPPEEQGANSSSLQISESLFSVVTIAVTGALLAALGRSEPSYLASLGMTVLIALTGTAIAVRFDQGRGAGTMGGGT
ncbi:MFS transporter [Thermopolyspora sp. NPDC052614]|uniref:MFS transporter n=1 Tax=Thermopolyspora sp. NPDC052614 TaxID=3155682 RepID=UPI003423C701